MDKKIFHLSTEQICFNSYILVNNNSFHKSNVELKQLIVSTAHHQSKSKFKRTFPLIQAELQ